MLRLIPFTSEHLPLFYAWAKKEHIKNTWFLEGYMSVDQIASFVTPNGADFPYIIEYDQKPIGYLLCCDLATYRNLPGTFCIDLFIAEEEYLNRGIGTNTVKLAADLLFSKYHASRILIDPSATNLRAIRCYEKAGFQRIGTKPEGVTTCLIMELKKPENTFSCI